MKFKLIIPGILITLCTLVEAQSMIGLPKEEAIAVMKKKHREFRKDNTVVKQQFNYIKYVNGTRTRTWILYFTEEDICKTSKLICDYSEFDKVIEGLSTSYDKAGESEWEYVLDKDTVRVALTKQEWYFTVREARKK